MADETDDNVQRQWAQSSPKLELGQLSLQETSPSADSAAPDVWATLTSSSTPAEPIAASQEIVTSSTASVSEPSAAQAVLSALAHPLPAHMLADLDPFAPSPPSTRRSSRTLGQIVKSSNSLLELLPNDDEEEMPSTDNSLALQQPGQQTAAHSGSQSSAIKQTFDNSGTPAELGVHGKGPSSGSGTGTHASGSFLGGMFRSISGSGSDQTTTSSAAHASKRDQSTIAQSGPSSESKPNARPNRPQVDTQHTQQPRSTSSTLTRPLTTLANAFKSATGSGSGSGTPERRASPSRGGSAQRKDAQFNEKAQDAAYPTSPTSPRRAGKERERDRSVRDREKHEKREEDREATFDFNKFLEQMRSRSADPVAKYLRSFLKEFSRRPPISVTDQIRVINDFLDFIAGKMRQVDPWKSLFVSTSSDWDAERAEGEFDMAMEAMEKLVMNRLWHLTFTPALDLSALPGQVSPTGDVERDQILAQRIKLFAWIKPSHLDLPIADPIEQQVSDGVAQDASIPPSPRIEQLISEADSAATASQEQAEEKGEKADKAASTPQERRQVQGFLDFARRELLKINNYKAPRDKMICVLNCCKVIFGLIRHVSSEEGADAFITFLIYVVLKANPEHLVSNLQYIQRFRNPEKLSGEGGYYLSSLNGAISFIETVDAASLSNITQAEFHENVAKAIRELPTEANESPRLSSRPAFPSEAPPKARDPPKTPEPSQQTNQRPPTPSRSPGPGAEVTAAAYTDSESPELLRLRNASPPPSVASFPESTRQFLLRSTDSVERIVSKPLGAIGRIFDQLEQTVSELPGGQQAMHGHPGTPTSPRRRNLPSLPAPENMQGPYNAYAPPSPSSKRRALWPIVGGGSQPGPPPGTGMFVEQGVTDTEAAREIDRQHEAQRQASLETLRSVFPAMEDDVLEMVLLSNSGDMARTIDSLLEMA